MFVIAHYGKILSVWPVVRALPTGYVTVAILDGSGNRRAIISFWDHEGYLVCPD